jgi:N-acetyl-alpha-D-glucosaminyl L-malate synthase BshA
VNIGIICYASIGGSGIVATELGKALALRGHQVHLVSTDLPFRLNEFHAGLSFHQVHTPSYPLFREPQYVLSLANRVVQVAREFRLEVIHAHYAVPHATAALLAQQVLSSHGHAPLARVVTTLHGTDITLVGSDPSFSEIVAYSIEQSDGVTAVSRSLAASTHSELCVNRDIAVIPNFLDFSLYRRIEVPGLRERFSRNGAKVVIHVSNFRPVKRIDAVMEVFARIAREMPARLVLVGDGPEVGTAHRLGRELGLSQSVDILGAQEAVLPLISAADVFLLPSAQESFGLAALESTACEVPVVASRVGGLPEVIEHGVSGFLHAPDDLDGMAASALAVMSDGDLRARITAAALQRVRQDFSAERVVPMYEAHYADVLR